MFSNYERLSPRDQKRVTCLWELFHTELIFLHKQLLTLRNVCHCTRLAYKSYAQVFKEPLKECQVEGCLLYVEPDLLFGNLEELCQVGGCEQMRMNLQFKVQISFRFCKLFDELVTEWVEHGTHGPTGILVKVFEKVCIHTGRVHIFV